MKLPLGVEFDDVVGSLRYPGMDPAGVDWTTVRRSAYVIHQRISYRYAGPVRNLRQRLVVHPREQHGDQRILSRRLAVLNASPRQVTHNDDAFGNNIVQITIPVVAEEVTFVSLSTVERHAGGGPHLTAATWLADRRLLLATELTAADEALRTLAEDLAGSGLQGVALAHLICERVYSEMAYAHDVTGVGTTAAQAFAQRAGVCQDFAHVMLAITRYLGLPSRYVSGQLIGDGGSHAWVEVLVPTEGGHAEVISLDPTHNRATTMTYLTIAVGRDYADVAPVSGTYRAGHTGHLTIRKRVSVMSIDTDDMVARSA